MSTVHVAEVPEAVREGPALRRTQADPGQVRQPRLADDGDRQFHRQLDQSGGTGFQGGDC